MLRGGEITLGTSTIEAETSIRTSFLGAFGGFEGLIELELVLEAGGAFLAANPFAI